ncbi:hypothetical protein PHLGIDRAFT_20479 [Phlebiopsis gigantea 11061_1 CR5-6]|uniref:Uncharacterized protein n=1 Tax=Phlebiopsis gigantea (strain 11061_1 CR5-6) TaxID=745531 RepID=A0A0C3S3D9_PHLG1|nr:hypothetical protein PHLGIDRAFT_20479 [Phlebiopsis gigantea 11061_1 CR5-6]
MVLALQTVYAPSSQDMTVVFRNHRDNVSQVLSPGEASMGIGGRWLDSGTKFTELDITTNYGRQATVVLQDDGNWNFVVSGAISGGKRWVGVDGNKDFDVRLTSDGAIEFTVWNGNWNSSQGSVFRVDILPFTN